LKWFFLYDKSLFSFKANNMKKFLMSLLGLLAFGLSSTGAMAQFPYGAYDCPFSCPGTNFNYGWSTSVNPGTGGYSTTLNVNSTNYTIYAVYGTYNDLASTYLTTTPWYTGNSTLAMQLTTAEHGQLGQAGGDAPPQVGVLFAYAAPGELTVPVTFWSNDSPLAPAGGSGGGAAPEMNASFIPQVGLMLGSLFFLMGRKKENTESMLTA
jgi:hypothetical protein